MLNWNECHEVESRPGIMSGVPVFKGTRVPVASLFENLDDGAKAEEFVEWFPAVKLEQVHAVLSFVQKSLLAA
jgi:uncharacterized protein (DUF433 family)